MADQLYTFLTAHGSSDRIDASHRKALYPTKFLQIANVFKLFESKLSTQSFSFTLDCFQVLRRWSPSFFLPEDLPCPQGDKDMSPLRIQPLEHGVLNLFKLFEVRVKLYGLDCFNVVDKIRKSLARKRSCSVELVHNFFKGSDVKFVLLLIDLLELKEEAGFSFHIREICRLGKMAAFSQQFSANP
jgi:hypothetical protein